MTAPAATAPGPGPGAIPSFTTSTNLGPLTTALSFAPNCFSNYYDMNIDGLGPTGEFKTQGCCLSSCCPSSHIYTRPWAWMTSYYSPGVCPSAYRSCDPPTGSGLILTPDPGEKIIFCCPQDYMCPNEGTIAIDVPGACGSRLYSSTEPAYYTVMEGITQQIPQATEVYDFGGSTTDVLIAYPIQIRLPDTDGTATRTAAGMTASGKTGSGKTATGKAASGTAAPGSTNSNQSTSKTLSIGVIIGIAFGGFFAVLIAICTFLYFCLKFRKRREKTAASGPYTRDGETHQSPIMSEVEGDEPGKKPYGRRNVGVELDASQEGSSIGHPPRYSAEGVGRKLPQKPMELPGDEHF